MVLPRTAPPLAPVSGELQIPLRKMGPTNHSSPSTPASAKIMERGTLVPQPGAAGLEGSSWTQPPLKVAAEKFFGF